MLAAPTLAHIRQAVANIRSKAIRTPLVKLNWQPPGLTSFPDIYLKLENLQPIGSFKVRAAANAIACIDNKELLRTAGVCTASAGNFAQGLAWCCSEEGIQCTVVAPNEAPQTKLSAIRRRGATVIQVPYSEWWKIIETRQCPQAPVGARFIHPGCENSVLAGNATTALEILEDLPDTDCIVVPFGSGALCTGVAAGVRASGRSSRQCRVLAVEPDTAAPFALSKIRGQPCRFDAWEASFVDGCGGKAVLEEMWHVARDIVDGGCAVSLASTAEAVRVLCERNRIVAEGAGACPVAAAMTGMCGDAKKIVCVVSGGGLDTEKLLHILEGRGVPPVHLPKSKL